MKKFLIFIVIAFLSPQFKSFCSGRISINPALRPTSDDSLCHMIDSFVILGSTYNGRPIEKKTRPWLISLENKAQCWVKSLNPSKTQTKAKLNKARNCLLQRESFLNSL